MNEAGKAWTSTDGTSWAPFDLGQRPLGTDPNGASEAYDFKLFPTGVYVNGWYGSGQ